MRKDLVVAIFTPTRGGQGGLSGIVGTGYPVTDDLVLTSAHVVAPENRNPRAPIRLRWFYDKPAGGRPPDWIPIRKADVVWVGMGDLDAALIRCRRPDSLRRFPLDRLAERRPGDGEHWQSVGFARANKRADLREPGHFGGTLREMAEGDAFFEILEDARPIAEDQWKGVSGMPVFVGAELLGVVKQVPPQYDHKKLAAVPSWRLLANRDFCAAIGRDEEQERLASARTLLSRLLERSDEATKDLAAALELPCGAIAGCRAQLVERLLYKTPSLERLFELSLAVQDRRRRLKDKTGARVAADLVLTILPAIHDAAAVADVRRRRGDPTLCPLLLPAKLPSLAEIIMAGADRRPAAFRPPPTRLVFPEGEASLPEPPECGRDADGKQFSRDWRTHLMDTFAADAGRFEGAFREYLKERFIQSELRSPHADIGEQELLDTIKAQLREWAEAPTGGLTYYFIVRLPENKQARSEREAVLAALKREFPHIAFLRLSGSEPLPKEVTRYGKLRDLLYEDPEPTA